AGRSSVGAALEGGWACAVEPGVAAAVPRDQRLPARVPRGDDAVVADVSAGEGSRWVGSRWRAVDAGDLLALDRPAGTRGRRGRCRRPRWRPARRAHPGAAVLLGLQP